MRSVRQRRRLGPGGVADGSGVRCNAGIRARCRQWVQDSSGISSRLTYHQWNGPLNVSEDISHPCSRATPKVGRNSARSRSMREIRRRSQRAIAPTPAGRAPARQAADESRTRTHHSAARPPRSGLRGSRQPISLSSDRDPRCHGHVSALRRYGRIDGRCDRDVRVESQDPRRRSPAPRSCSQS